MADHTPGPWIFISGAFNNGDDQGAASDAKGSIRADDARVWIACIERTYRGEDEANAALICASPDLLSALRMMMERYRGQATNDGSPWDGIAWRLAEHAVSKAEGVSTNSDGDES